MNVSLQVAAVVLAAGRSQRFGSTKQLLLVQGRPLVVHAVDAARAAGCSPVFVVVGHDADRVGTVLPDDVVVVPNPDYSTGQASSVRAGISAVAATDAAGVVMLLADQPGIDQGAIRLVASAVIGGHDVVRARYQDGPGHPVAFARKVFDDLRRITGDVGARDILDDVDVHDLAVNGLCPRDVDTRADLRHVLLRNGEGRGPVS